MNSPVALFFFQSSPPVLSSLLSGLGEEWVSGSGESLVGDPHLVACFCAIPMNSDTLLEIQGAPVGTSKPALGVTFQATALLGRPWARVPSFVLVTGCS